MVAHGITGTPERRHQDSLAKVQRLTTHPTTTRNAELMVVPFSGELDEWNMGDLDCWADYPIHSGRSAAVKFRCACYKAEGHNTIPGREKK